MNEPMMTNSQIKSVPTEELRLRLRLHQRGEMMDMHCYLALLEQEAIRKELDRREGKP